MATDAVPAFEWSKSITEKHGTLVSIGQPKEKVPFHCLDFIAQDLAIVAGCLDQPAVIPKMVCRPAEIGKRMDDHKPEMKGKLVVTMS